MQAIWLEQQKLKFLDDLPSPLPANGEALVRVRLAGICSTDLELVKGYYPYTGVLGHEFVGEVVQVGGDEPDQRSWVGQRVVGEINIACGKCDPCRSGMRSHCEQRKVLGILGHNGAFAEFLLLPLVNLHRVPGSIPDEAAVFTEPLAAALEIQQQVQLHPADRILVLGAGRLGQLVAQTLALTGSDLRVVARYPAQIELLAGRGIYSISEHQVEARKYDLVVEATGSPSGFELARKAVRPRGTIILKSTFKREISLNLSPLVVDEITLVGSRCGPFEPAIRLLERRQVDVVPLVAAQYRLCDGLAALEYASRPGALKVLLQTDFAV